MTAKKTRTGVKALMLAYGLFATAAQAQSNDAQARALLKAMSDYIGGLAAIETSVDTSLEIVTPEMQKIAFTSTSLLRLARPNQVRLERAGGYSNVEFWYDGVTFTIRGRDSNLYAQVPVAGTTDNLVRTIQDGMGLAVPGADLLLRDSYSILVADVLEAKFIGQGVVAGQMCDHVAFRNFDTDWQLWIRQGPEKAPCKMIITSKTVGMAPQYTTHVRSWKGNQRFPAGTFDFRPAAGEQRVDLARLSEIDEVPTMQESGEPK
ncbi:MAG: DUF2092 domain-containing protein [Sandaracinobacter sp.]